MSARAIAERHAAKIRDPFDKCRGASIALASALTKAGHDAQVLRCSHLLPYARDAHRKWQALGSQLYWIHYVVAVGDEVFDLTRRQFFPECAQPHIQTRAELAAEWDGVDPADLG